MAVQPEKDLRDPSLKNGGEWSSPAIPMLLHASHTLPSRHISISYAWQFPGLIHSTIEAVI